MTRRRGPARVFALAVAFWLLPVGHALAVQQTPLPPDSPFAQVGRGDGAAVSIGRRQLWRFQRAVVATERTGGAAPPIDPPAYSRCIAFLEHRREARGARRQTCARLDLGSQARAAEQLLNLHWLIAEAHGRGIRFTEARVAHQTHATVQSMFGSERGRRRWHRETGLSDGDLRLYVVAQELSQRAIVRQIEARVDTSGLHQDDPDQNAIILERRAVALDAFRDAFRLRWHAATTCIEPYARLAACAATPSGSG